MLEYPLSATRSGDLSLTTDDRSVIRSRILLLLDCDRNDREMLPEFGSSFQQFSPDEGSATLDAELLKLDLERWCQGEFAVEFEVTPKRFASGRFQLQVSFNV